MSKSVQAINVGFQRAPRGSKKKRYTRRHLRAIRQAKRKIVQG